MKIQISGFTIVRNAQKLDYPFVESVRSALPLCDEFIIGCGDSEDGTRQICASLQTEFPDKVKVFDSQWQPDRQTGGMQLALQSDAAMNRCTGDWCLYIQADEVFHEGYYDNLRAAIQLAHSRPEIDAVVFDYVHFYGSYAYEIRGRNWYRREVRAFKNGRGIRAYKDAQGFRKYDNRLRAISSGAKVFHYGYVRSPRSLDVKSAEMAKWWAANPASNIQTSSAAPTELVRHIGLRKFRGSHPAVMRSRIAEHSFPFEPHLYRRKWDKREIKNAITLAWESIVPYRIGEFRNYNLVR